ncbi:MAG: sigma-70 family RNA polymerase sigma factor [Candidatus Thermofonsia bacterium]|nr:MAG: sigma-70 family RNA polymerase sigma factor [Candidatus Thermofonsia bacterium]
MLMDENALIQDAKQGDVNAFNHLVITYQQLAYNVAYRIMGDPQLAEDRTQEAFISAYQNLNQFRGGSFKSWLLRIVTNSCYDELRRYKRRPQSSLEEMTDESESWDFLQNDDDTPEQFQQRVEMVKAIEACLQALPDEQRIVAVLCDVEGFDYQEIAHITKNALGTVKSRISRARARLRDCLQSLFGELLPDNYRLGSEGTN